MPEDTHEDIRRRLFEAVWDASAFAPYGPRTVARARRRAATTIVGAAFAALAAIAVVSASIPFDSKERTAGVPTSGEDLDFLVDLRTGESTEIRGLARVYAPDVHPDGERLVYASDVSGTLQIWVSNLDGSRAERLTDDPYGADVPVWSPTGDRIAYVGFGNRNNNRQLFVLDVATGRSVRLTQSRAVRDAWAPAWSPDGRSISYQVPIKGDSPQVEGFPNVGSFGYQVRVVDLATRNVRVVAGGSDASAYDATWIPGGRLAFVWASDLTVSPDRQGLYAETDDRRRPERLLELENADQTWMLKTSPDGQRIAFVRVVDGVESVYVYDLLTEDVRRVRSGFIVTWVDDNTLLVQQRAPERPEAAPS